MIYEKVDMSLLVQRLDSGLSNWHRSLDINHSRHQTMVHMFSELTWYGITAKNSHSTETLKGSGE